MNGAASTCLDTLNSLTIQAYPQGSKYLILIYLPTNYWALGPLGYVATAAYNEQLLGFRAQGRVCPSVPNLIPTLGPRTKNGDLLWATLSSMQGYCSGRKVGFRGLRHGLSLQLRPH